MSKRLSKNAELSAYQNHTETEIKSETFIYTWKITNYMLHSSSVDKPLESKSFSKNDKSLWIINLYKEGAGYDVHGQYFNDRVTIKVDFDINVIIPHINSIGNYYFITHIIQNERSEYEVYNQKGSTISFPISFSIDEEALLNQKNRLLINNNLTLRFKMFIATGEVVIKPQPVFFDSSNDNKPKSSGLISILNDPKFSDIKIVIGDKEFYVYKGILASQSPVFAAMFEHKMKESIENVVEVTDVDHGTMQELLQFIYSGKINNKKSVTKDLLAAADKYEIEELKLLCEKVLLCDLKVETVSDLLIHAEKYGAAILKKCALEFFKLHVKEIIQREKFDEEISSLLPLLPDILKFLIL